MLCWKCGNELTENDKLEIYESIYRCSQCGEYNTK